MVDDQQIKQWLAEGVITQEQASKMLADATQQRKARASDKVIVTMSTVGAVLLGIGAILFVASNWQVMSNLMKVLTFAGATFGAYALGYFLAYQSRTSPKVGAALIFLGALLFGATIFLVAQIYHIQAHSHALLLWWLLGILPLVYVLRSLPVAGLAAVLAFVWMGLFVFRGMSPEHVDWLGLPVLYLASALLLFEAGGLHYRRDTLRPVARAYRIAALKVVMVCLFLLSFRLFAGTYEGFNPRADRTYSPQFSAGVVSVAVLAAGLAVLNLSTNPSKSETWKLEGWASLALLGIALIFFLFPAKAGNFYVIVFNLVLACCIALLIAIGYQREDIRVVNIGMSYLSLLVLVRYCDWFWALLPRSLFFIVGGLILVGGGIALEQKRRQLKVQFSQ
jgi:uncharacterized membrane protein